jgi:uncharacterized protein (DUF983 family)
MSTDNRSLSTPITRGLRARCPRCGEGRLFQGFLTLRPKCERCGLDYSFADAADGPAVFVIFISGFIRRVRGARGGVCLSAARIGCTPCCGCR